MVVAEERGGGERRSVCRKAAHSQVVVEMHEVKWRLDCWRKPHQFNTVAHPRASPAAGCVDVSGDGVTAGVALCSRLSALVVAGLQARH